MSDDEVPRGWRWRGIWQVVPRSLLVVLALLLTPTLVQEVGLAWRWYSLRSAAHRLESWRSEDSQPTESSVDLVVLPRAGIVQNVGPSLVRDFLAKLAPWLIQSSHVRAITLVGTRYDDEALQFAANRFPEVFQLRLERCDVTPAGLQALKRWRQLSSVQLVGLKLDGASLAALDGLVELQTLEIEQCSAIDDLALRQFPSLPQLRVLNLETTGAGARGLRGLAQLSQLQNLNLVDEELTDEGLLSFPVLPRLKLLSLRSPRLKGRFLKRLADLPELSVLETIGSPIDDEGLQSLPEGTGLRGLFLVGSRITGPGLEALSRLSALDDLSLAEAPLSDSGVMHLPDLPQLLAFNLSETAITTQSFSLLQQRCPELKTLLVSVSDRLTQADLDTWEAAHPRWVEIGTWWKTDHRLAEYSRERERRRLRDH